MNMDSIKELLTNFDLGNFLPKIDTIMGWVTLLLRLAVMAGPVIILVLGLILIIAPPKEANYRFGYRCFFGMGSVEAWLHTQKIAGIIYGGLGIVLGIIMGIVCIGLKNKELIDAFTSAITWLIVQVGIVLLVYFGLWLYTAIVFDRHGNRRKDKKK